MTPCAPQAEGEQQQRQAGEVARLKDAIATLERSERQLLKARAVAEAQAAEAQAALGAAQAQAADTAHATGLVVATAVAAAHAQLQQQVRLERAGEVLGRRVSPWSCGWGVALLIMMGSLPASPTPSSSTTPQTKELLDDKDTLLDRVRELQDRLGRSAEQRNDFFKNRAAANRAVPPTTKQGGAAGGRGAHRGAGGAGDRPAAAAGLVPLAAGSAGRLGSSCCRPAQVAHPRAAPAPAAPSVQPGRGAAAIPASCGPHSGERTQPLELAVGLVM